MSRAGIGDSDRINGHIPLSRERNNDSLRVDLADDVTAGVGNIDLAQVVHGDVVGLVELCVYGQPQVTAGTRNAGTSDGGYYAVERVDLSDSVIERVSDIDIAVPIYVHSMWGMKGCVQGGAFIALECGASGPREGGDDSGSQVDPSNAVVTGVGNIKVVIVVESETEGRVQLGGRCGTSVSGEARIASPGKGGDYVTFDIDLANSMSRAIGDIDIAAAIDSDSVR